MARKKGTGAYSKNTLTFAKRLEIYEVLKEHCSKTPNGADYAPGWSDKKVAEEVPGTVPHNVGSVRREMFGDLYVRSTSRAPQLQDHEERIALLEATVADLERKLQLGRKLLSNGGEA